MYLFFVCGYLFAFHYRSWCTGFRYWKIILLLYSLAYFAFNFTPYDSSGVVLISHNYAYMMIGNILKIILGITGSCLVLLMIYKLTFLLKNTWIEQIAVERGRYTLDIYLLNIILLETLGASLYKRLVELYNFNFLYAYGSIFEIIGTFVITFFMMEIIVLVGNFMNRNRLISKIFFYR